MSTEATAVTKGRDIREIAPSGTGDDGFLTTDFSGRVSYWRGVSPEPVTTFGTTWSFGGRRLALGGDAHQPVAVTAAWERHGVCAYDAGTGALLWQRKDVKRVQDLAAPPGSNVVTACSDDGPMQVLDLSDGSTLARVRGVRRCWAGFDTPLVGEVLHGVVVIDTGNWTAVVRRTTPGWFKPAVAVSSTAALISAVQDQHPASAALRCLTLTGESVWQWDGPPDVLCHDLSWDATSSSWLGLLRDVTGATPDRLVRWSVAGELTTVAEIGSTHAQAFVLGGARLLLSDGSAIDTASGTRTGNFG